MKEIRQIRDVITTSVNCNDENNNDPSKASLIREFDCEPGFYQQVLRPMLLPGHENELVYWLRSFGLISNIQICRNLKENEFCTKSMAWTPAKVQDLYQWKCLDCQVKRAIREKSVFADVKCTFKNAIRILLGWIKGMEIEYIANMLDVKKTVVGNLYNTSAAIAEKHIKSHFPQWRLGGRGKIVLIDTYPEGCANSTSYHRSSCRPILCIAEVQSVPQKLWFEALEHRHHNNVEQRQIIKNKILATVQEVVTEGSTLIVPLMSTFCSYHDLLELKEIYPQIVTIETLAKHNNKMYNVYSNLEVIWKSTHRICEEAQYYHPQFVQQFLTSEMWRHRFGNDAFETLMYQMTITQ